MSYKVIFVLLLCQYSVFTCAQNDNKFFRNDYTYSDSTESFYKIHTFKKSWMDAKKMCEMEGASLFYPKDKNENAVVAGLLTSNQIPNGAYIGASALLAKGVYLTTDGISVSQTYNNWAPQEPNNLGNSQDCVNLASNGYFDDVNCEGLYPFVCKKTLASLQWNQLCNMPIMDYEYDEATSRCYKFHPRLRSWSDAVATCNAELSYLAVINSPLEAEVLANITAKATKDSGTVCGDFVHLGFQKFVFDEGWLTIKGTPLSNSGYSQWADGEPNNVGDEKCGSMFYNGRLNDMKCHERCYFICEHDIDTTTLLDEIL